MKASLFSIVTVLFSGFVSSCSQCYYDDYVKSYLGKSSSELLFDWGTPSNLKQRMDILSFNMSNTKILLLSQQEIL